LAQVGIVIPGREIGTQRPRRVVVVVARVVVVGFCVVVG